MKTQLSLLLSLFLSAALYGCAGVLSSDQPPVHMYWLEPAKLDLGQAPAESLPELLVIVRSVPGLDTDRVMVKEPGSRMNYYAGARWPDHLPEVMTATVRLSFESSGRFSSVSSRSQANGDEWLLDLELREFFAVAAGMDSAPQIHVHLAGYLNCGFGITPISASVAVPAQENKLSTIVAAFQEATDDALINLGGRLEAECFSKNARPEKSSRRD